MVKVNNRVRIRVSHYYKINIDSIKEYLKSLNISNISDELIQYDKYLSSKLYKLISESKMYPYYIVIKDIETIDNINYLENLQVDINKFVSYVIYKLTKKDIENKNKKIENILNSQNILNDVVFLEEINGKETDILEFFNKFLLEHNNLILSNEDIILSKEQQERIIFKIHNLLLDLIKICDKNQIESIPALGNNFIEVYEFYKKDRLLSEKVTSKLLRALLYTMKDLCYVNDNKIISENLRFNILKLYFETWILKTNIIIEELDKNGFRWDFSKSKYYQAKFMKSAEGIQPEFEKYNAYLSNDIELKNEIYLLPFYYNGKGNKHKSHHIKPTNASKIIHFNEKQLGIEEYEKLTDAEKEAVTFEYHNTNYLNVYNDTEISWIFRKRLTIPELRAMEIKLTNGQVIALLNRNILEVGTDNKLLLNEDNYNQFKKELINSKNEVLENGQYYINITRDEFIQMNKEQIEHLKSLNVARLNKLKQNDFDLDNLIDCVELLKHDYYAVSDIRVHQSCFVNEKTNEADYILFVDERHKNQYDKNYLDYTYTQKFKGKVIDKTIHSKIIYTKNVVTSYFEYLINWYREQHNDIDSKKLNCRCWYHNLKFDSLAIGLQNIFRSYSWELKNYKTTTPVFFKFDIPFEIENRKGNTIRTSIEFVDSFNFINQSLEKLGLQVGITKLKELVNFNWNNNLDINKDFLTYSLMDIEILKEAMENLKSIALKYAPFTKLGTAGTALNTLYTSFYGHVKDTKRKITRYENKYITKDGLKLSSKEYKKLEKKAITDITKELNIKVKDRSNNTEFKNKLQEYKNQFTKEKETYEDNKKVLIHKHKNRILEEIEQFSYFGGRTQVFRKIGEYKKYISIDINSSYPTAMLQKIPYEYKTSYNFENLSNFEVKRRLKKIFESQHEYVLARVFIPHDSNRIVPVKRDSKVCFDELFNTDTVLHVPELQLLLERNSNIKILEIHVFYASNEIFKDFVNEFMFSKSYHKSITGDEISITWAKLNANSVYGKFAERELISVCKPISDDEEIEFFTILLSLKHKYIVDEQQLSSYMGYIDITLDDLRLYTAVLMHNTLFDDNIIDKLISNKIYQDIKNQISTEETSIRIEFFSNYYSYSKKSNKPSNKASLVIAGAITSYARTNLYKAMEIIGFNRIFYCDTDSIYFELFNNETVEDIKKLYFNDIDECIQKDYIMNKLQISEYDYNNNIKEYKNKFPIADILKENLTSKQDYLKYLEKVQQYWLPNKINISKGIVSKNVLWELEIDKAGEILVQGNKANIKSTWEQLSIVSIYHNESEKQELIKKHLAEYGNNKKYKTILISSKEMKAIRKNKNLILNDEIKIKKEQKNKGVSGNAIRVNYNLYFVLLWDSIKSCLNHHNIIGQVVRPFVKYLAGLDHYSKDEVIEKTVKYYEYLDKLPILDNTYEKVIPNLFELKYQKMQYTEQILKPYQMSNLNQLEKYYHKSGFDIVSEYKTTVDYVKHIEKIENTDLIAEFMNF
jgi:hypothetical protein